MTRLFVFGLGYAARAIAMRAGGVVMATTRDGRDGTIRFDDDAAVMDESERVEIGCSVAQEASGEFGEMVRPGSVFEGDDHLEFSKGVHADDDRRAVRSAGAGSLLEHLLNGQVGVSERAFDRTAQGLVEFALALRRLLVGGRLPCGSFAPPLLLKRCELLLLERAECSGTTLKLVNQHGREQQRDECRGDEKQNGGAPVHGW